MGEIKSTLDLVLEKTKHLSQSSDEKQAQIRKDVEIRIKGILQKLNQEKDRLVGSKKGSRHTAQGSRPE